MVLAFLGVLGAVLISINPVFRMMGYVVLSAAAVYYLAKVIKVKRKYKPIYCLGTFFTIIILLIVAPTFMTLFPATEFAVTGEAALAQATLGGAATQPQVVLILMQLTAAGTFCGIAAGRAKNNIQLVILSLVAALVSIFIIFGLLLV